MTDLKSNWAPGETYAASDQNKVAQGIHGLNGSGVYSALPAAGFTGREYLCTDNGNTYRDNGTTWDLISVAGMGVPGIEPPTSGWSTTTLGTATVATDKGGRLFTGPAGNGTDLRVEYRTLAAGNYTATAHIDLTASGANYITAGLVLRVSAGNIIQFGPAFNNGWFFRVTKYTNTSTYNSDYTSPVFSAFAQGAPNWFRIVDDGTNRIFRASNDGVTWITVYSGSRTDFLTATQIGWCCNGPSSGIDAVARMRSFSVV